MQSSQAMSKEEHQAFVNALRRCLELPPLYLKEKTRKDEQYLINDTHSDGNRRIGSKGRQ